ncbi:pseudouridine synthase [Infundibulicybe gibba]|nr:pseudouridine synthase [Infundibulicybe gibba]
MSSLVVHEREQDDGDIERYSKRSRIDEDENQAKDASTDPHILPPSHALLGIPLPVAQEGAAMNFMETDVGISEYIGKDVSKIEGIIKQRFTDFLVYEVDLDGNVIHIKSLGKPDSPKQQPPPEAPPAALTAPEAGDDAMEGVESTVTPEPMVEKRPRETEINEAKKTTDGQIEPKVPQEPWPEHFTTKLAEFLSADAIANVKQIYLEGPEPPRVSDSGWGARSSKSEGDGDAQTPLDEADHTEGDKISEEGRGKGRRGGRGGRRGRGGGRGGRQEVREDHRKVLSDPITSKSTRTALHQTIRELFGGKLDSETDSSAPVTDEGSRIVIKGRGGGGGSRSERGTYPPYIHFSMQKTNRDTQDALGHLARTLHVNVKDLSVAGTKDKRGVTVQRVSLKRNGKTVEDIWKLANGRKSAQDGVWQRGERGIRIADFNYRKASLELGMLKGNAFVITLRSVKVDSIETLDKALNTVKHKGFINYYGMQRFGTASVPTHSIGLALLKSEWQKAVSLLLQKRHGEHPDVEAARDAWLVDGDVDKALQMMPRRVIAERCLLESFKKQGGDTRNAMGALSTIPRNLRLMYIHAYQSYVWNAIVSERIRTYGADKPVAGDLVFENSTPEMVEPMEKDDKVETEDAEEGGSSRSRKRSRKPWVPPRIKTLTEEDLGKYSIFDVIMPLPGTDVAYPGGSLGDRYREFLRIDGLDPDNFVRKQKEYTLNGSYRAILHLPKELSWSILRYTDPDVALAQADEDKLLGFDPPVIVEDGKFMALQINITLGTASYATMALREITKTETSSHFQTSLTAAAEDQKFRGVELGAEKEED